MTSLNTVIAPTEGDAILNLLRQQALVVVRLAERVLARRQEDLAKRTDVSEESRQALLDYARQTERISVLTDGETIDPIVLTQCLSQLTKSTSGLIDAEAALWMSQAPTVFAIREMCGAMEVVSLTLAVCGGDVEPPAETAEPVELGVTTIDRLIAGATSLVVLVGKGRRDWSTPVEVCLDWLTTQRDEMCPEEVSVVLHELTPAMIMATLTRDSAQKDAATQSLLALQALREGLPPALRNAPPQAAPEEPQGRFAATFRSSGTRELSLKSRLTDSMRYRTTP